MTGQFPLPPTNPLPIPAGLFAPVASRDELQKSSPVSPSASSEVLPQLQGTTYFIYLFILCFELMYWFMIKLRNIGKDEIRNMNWIAVAEKGIWLVLQSS